MGLDMYLTAERYLWSYPEDGPDAKIGDTIAALFPELASLDAKQDQRVKEISVQVGYWRKANQIHHWFVKNVQDGKDECQRAYVTAENLTELLGVVNAVLSASDVGSAAMLLPTGSGFFFGSTEYDEWYFKDLEYTKALLESILSNEALLKDWTIYYQSSW